AALAVPCLRAKTPSARSSHHINNTPPAAQGASDGDAHSTAALATPHNSPQSVTCHGRIQLSAQYAAAISAVGRRNQRAIGWLRARRRSSAASLTSSSVRAVAFSNVVEAVANR